MELKHRRPRAGSSGSPRSAWPAWAAFSFLFLALVVASATGQPKFHASELEGAGLLFCDIDGDSLKDALLLQETNAVIFFQDTVRGFKKLPDQRCELGAMAAIVWTAQLGRAAESLLLMTSEGVSELRFTNRTGPPTREILIRQPTSVPQGLDAPGLVRVTSTVNPKVGGRVPEAFDGPKLVRLPLSARTATAWPLILIPVEGNLQTWQHRQDWELAQTLEKSFDIRLWPDPQSLGYIRTLGLCLAVADLNGDGRDDLVVRRQNPAGTRTFSIYLQGTNGLFAAGPTLSQSKQSESDHWLCFMDLNRDGQVDLVKSTWLNEPWFIPGSRSGKVLVGIHLANAHGELPAEPQQVFRKNDWQPDLPVLDIDGDGFPDLVLGYGLIDSREGVRKTMIAKQLDLSLKFHFYRPRAGYPKEPDCQRDLVLHLDQHTIALGWAQRDAYQHFVNVTGDFNGDGKRDLLVRDRSQRLSVYFFISREQGFRAEPNLQFTCPEPIDWLEPRDLNADGISDLVIKLQNRDAYRAFVIEKP